jgi:4-carboxymuconolactone decarboxylase
MISHGRLPWPIPEELGEPARALYDCIAGGPRAAGPQVFPLTDADGRLNGPFNAMLVNPEVGAAVQELGSAIRYKTRFAARAREIAILELAQLRRSEFEWYAHVRIGRQAGLTADELSSLRTGDVATTFSAAERMVRDVVRHLVVERDLDDATYFAASELLGEQDLYYVVALVGHYESLALALRVFRTPLPAGAEPELS